MMLIVLLIFAGGWKIIDVTGKVNDVKPADPEKWRKAFEKSTFKGNRFQDEFFPSQKQVA